MKKLILFIGAPASGKTTTASLIANKYPKQMVHYSTGDMLRAEVAQGTPRSEKINAIISQGNIVPVELIMETITTAILEAPADIVLLDGYPRSIEQMEALDNLLTDTTEIKLINILEIKVSENIAKVRILGRINESIEARNDDSEEIFNERMRIYNQPLEEIKTFYSNQSLLTIINGEQTINEVVEEIDSVLTALLN